MYNTSLIKSILIYKLKLFYEKLIYSYSITHILNIRKFKKYFKGVL